MNDDATVTASAEGFSRVTGIFHRAVDPAFSAAALSGSREPGRYSSIAEPTLYLSASRAGVEAAMIAHRADRASAPVVLRLRVDADAIVDLRDPAALEAFGVTLADAAAPWRDIVRAGGAPSSWRVRRTLEERGAAGLIDPSRRAPGLWHLVLFRWNAPGVPRVAPAG